MSSSVQRRSIPVARPWIGEAEADAVRRPILSGWVTQGPEVAAFEQEFAAFVDAEHACAVANCTVSLHLALKALGVGPGDEVITVSHSFIATANAVRYVGAVPVFADIEPRTFNMDPALIEALITPRTRAILCVHQMGMPCNLAEIVRVAHDHGLPVVEDAACAVGSEIQWQGQWERIGKPHGDVACFSFHPRKLLTTGDGGMLTTADAALDERFRRLRQHAMTVSDTARHAASSVVFEEYEELGFNYRLTDIQASVGREQLKRLPEAVARRRSLADRYAELLSAIPGLELPFEPAWARTNWQSYCVRLPASVDQRTVMDAMLAEGISTRRGIMNAHLEPAYRQEPWLSADRLDLAQPEPDEHPSLRHSEQAQRQCILLPLFHDLTDDDQQWVARALKAACGA